MKTPYNGKNRRRVFRLRLPPNELLRAVVEDLEYEVVEVAEFSVVFNCAEVRNQNGKCSGVIHWSDGSQSNFLGGIGRLNGENRVVWNVTGISMQDVIGEQRRILAKYPAVKKTGKAA